MKKIICPLLFLLPLFLQAQQVNVDSLINVLNTQKLKPDEQILIYRKICKAYIHNDPDKVIEYAKKGLAIAEREKDIVQASKFNDDFGKAYHIKGKFDTALVYFGKSLDLAKKAKDREQEACVYINLGVLSRQGNLTAALEYYLKALPIYESTGNKINCAIILTNMGSIHRTLKNMERALYYVEQAKAIDETIDDPLVRMGTYFELGCIYMDMDDYEKGLEYQQKVYEIARNTGNKSYEAASMQAMGTYYAEQAENLDKAIECTNECLRIGKAKGDTRLIVGSYSTLSSIYAEQENWKECEAAAYEAWKIDSTDMHHTPTILYNLIFSNILLGNKDKATNFLSAFYKLFTKKTDEDFHKILMDMEVKYETEKKEMRIAALEKDKKLYAGLGIATATALLSGMGLLFYRHRARRKLAEQQIRQLEQEKELIAARSALDAEKAEREIIARDLHDGVGAMLSVVKNNMNIMKSYSVIENREVDHFNRALDGLDKSIVELRRVAHHIMPAILIEKGLFAALDDFCRSIPEAEFHHTEPERRLDSEKELALYRCAYELVSNALRHAKASRIEVHLNIDEETAYLSVVDNGCGFDPQTVPLGMGIKNLRTRLAAFGGSMDIYPEPGKGTEANVELKI